MNRKEQLKQELALHKQGINEDLELISKKGKRIALAALAVGGTFFLSYSIAKGIASACGQKMEYEVVKGTQIPKEAPKPKKSGFGSKIAGILMTELAILLVGFAKNEVKSYISNFKIGKDDSEGAE